jgi:hypothetical protein
MFYFVSSLFRPRACFAADHGAGPSPPLSRSERIDRLLERIAACQQKLKEAKAEKVRALEVASNLATLTITSTYEEAEKAFQSILLSFRMRS